MVRSWKDCFKSKPKKVALLGLGGSVENYKNDMCASTLSEEFDQVWALNFGIKLYRHDIAFIMDDLRVQSKKFPAYETAMKNHNRPIICPKAYPEFPASLEFPIREVVDFVKDDYFSSTVGYAIALACMIGVKNMTFYGCDFFYPGQVRKEEGAQNAAYLLGLCREKGMDYRVTPGSTFLGSDDMIMMPDRAYRIMYGYAEQPLIPKEAVQAVDEEKKRLGVDRMVAMAQHNVSPDGGVPQEQKTKKTRKKQTAKKG